MFTGGEITHVGQDTWQQSLRLEGRGLGSAFCFHRKYLRILSNSYRALWGNCPWSEVLTCFVVLAKCQRMKCEVGNGKVSGPFPDVMRRWNSVWVNNPSLCMACWVEVNTDCFKHCSCWVWSTSGCASVHSLWGGLHEESLSEFTFGLCPLLIYVFQLFPPSPTCLISYSLSKPHFICFLMMDYLALCSLTRHAFLSSLSLLVQWLRNSKISETLDCILQI